MLCTFPFMQKCNEIIHVHQKCGKHHDLANSVMTPFFFTYANRNKAEPREVTKQVVWIILRYRIFHGTFRHIRSGFPSYARTVCALTLLAYALKLCSKDCVFMCKCQKVHKNGDTTMLKIFIWGGRYIVSFTNNKSCRMTA